MRFFVDELGFRLDAVTPADDPAHVRLSGHGLRLALERGYAGDPGTLTLMTANAAPREPLTAPNGTRIEFVPADPPLSVPEPRAQALVRTADAGGWTRGRAGMLYRDLVPDRLGGYLIASHIRIPAGGPVPDNVHHHAVRFQFIYCRGGWVRLVYEDQGAPFVMRAGDCVLQPPHIRHRVLEASDGLEVIEFASPAAHMTELDHAMTLPTGRHLPARVYNGQTFVLHRAAQTPWEPRAGKGVEARDIGLKPATGGLVDMHTLRFTDASARNIEAHIGRDAIFTFLFILRGSVNIMLDALPETRLAGGGACVIPADSRLRLERRTRELELLEFRLTRV